MKKHTQFTILIVFCLILLSPSLSHMDSLPKVKLAVRVFDRENFVDDLSLDDFELYENGERQNLSSLYLIKNSRIERMEGLDGNISGPQKHFVLIFEVSEVSSKLEETVDGFVQNVLFPGDSLTIATPLKTYRMKNDMLKVVPKMELSRQIRNILRNDVLTARAEYRNILRDIERVAKALSVFPDKRSLDVIEDTPSSSPVVLTQDGLITRYISLLNILEDMRKVSQDKLINFSHSFKDKDGQKNIFLFYQRESIPFIKPSLLDNYLSLSQDRPDVIHSLSYLSEFALRDLSFDINRLKHAFLDSSVSLYVLFFTLPPEYIDGLDSKVISENEFEAFQELAETTGGMVDWIDSPGLLFKKADELLGNFYLLCYEPSGHETNQEFVSIEVKVKNESFKVIYRKGYYATLSRNGE